MARSLIVNRAEFQTALLGWYRANARPLPWRANASAYKTVVSEFMLQQTQVKTVLPYFARWLEEFPDFAALAAAREERVLKLWEGLGYYSRARNLHRLARVVAARKELPRSAAEWRELPGVGPYTAAAITSISFGAPEACVDGNVVRILARLTADATPFQNSASAAKAFAAIAEQMLTRETPGDHNQAMMELGATVCVRHNPLCLTCPVQRHCAAVNRGEPEAYPKLAAKLMERRTVNRAWCERDGALLLHRAAEGARRFANIHELPSIEQIGLDPARVAKLEPLVVKRRGITRFQITETIYVTRAPRGKIGDELRWVPLGDLSTITLSGPHRRWVTEILSRQKR